LRPGGNFQHPAAQPNGAELPAGLCDACDVDMAFLTVLGPKAARPVVELVGA
jgi:hypothetical protein